MVGRLIRGVIICLFFTVVVIFVMIIGILKAAEDIMDVHSILAVHACRVSWFSIIFLVLRGSYLVVLRRGSRFGRWSASLVASFSDI